MKGLVNNIRNVYANPLDEHYVHRPVYRMLYTVFFAALLIIAMNLSWYWPEPANKGSVNEFSGSFLGYHKSFINKRQDYFSIETSAGPRKLLMPKKRFTEGFSGIRKSMQRLNRSDQIVVRVINAYDGQWPIQIVVNGSTLYQKSASSFERLEREHQGSRKVVTYIAISVALMIFFLPWLTRRAVQQDILRRREDRRQ